VKSITPTVSNFYCRIQRERLLYDIERDLLATAKFLVGLRPFCVTLDFLSKMKPVVPSYFAYSNPM